MATHIIMLYDCAFLKNNAMNTIFIIQLLEMCYNCSRLASLQIYSCQRQVVLSLGFFVWILEFLLKNVAANIYFLVLQV